MTAIVTTERGNKMAEYINRDAFVADKRKRYCEDCHRRKGMKNGKMRFCYEIGGAPCRACEVDDMFNDIEDYPAADVAEVKHGKWIWDDLDRNAYYCSECSHAAYGNTSEIMMGEYRYCPNYGAKMYVPDTDVGEMDGDGDV